MKIKKLTYKINNRFNKSGFELVEGYAIDSTLPVRLCVRKTWHGYWKCDHYDTGYSIGGIQESRKEAVNHGIDVVSKAIESGEYAAALKMHGFAP